MCVYWGIENDVVAIKTINHTSFAGRREIEIHVPKMIVL